jgi:two-component system, LytTR family, response regulator
MTALIRQSKLRAALITPNEPVPGHLVRISAESRHGTTLVDCSEIDWMESQGNYVALHVGPKVHMARRTLTSLADRVDSKVFVRIHRRVVVNVTKIRSMKSLSNGDAVVHLVDGTELRSSRSFGKRLREAFRART